MTSHQSSERSQLILCGEQESTTSSAVRSQAATTSGRRGLRLTDEERKERGRVAHRKWRAANPEKVRAYSRKWRSANPQWSLFTRKRSGAKRAGVEFTLAFEDIWWPTHCPALGILLEYKQDRGNGPGHVPGSPSFDRVDPARGYVPDNVLIISTRANTLKNNATAEELEAVARWIRSLSETSHKGDTVA